MHIALTFEWETLRKGVGPKFLFIVSDDAMHYILPTTVVLFLYLPSNTGPLPKHSDISQQHGAQGDGKENQERGWKWAVCL